jgi:glycosyltransferase involved in cell wall biosynthesis
MNGLVIVGRYPFAERRLEGMVQRILSIDEQLVDIPRIYLDLYLLKHLNASYTRIGNVQVYTASFLRFFSILRILRQANEIYVHSIYFYALILLPLLFTRRSVRLILDVHGAVPEEMQYNSDQRLARIMNWVERLAFSRIALAVCVTRRMENFYRDKYPATTAEFLYLPIFTARVCGPADPVQVSALRTRLGIPEFGFVYLYSGGLQPWQNIDRMLDATRNLLSSNDSWFIFLTGEAHNLAARIEQAFGCLPKQILVAHVSSEELRDYYALADFGFILRDDHILNRVANPTKLVEYLYFGMRPIVISPDIGDFPRMGYEFVSIASLGVEPVFKLKSKVNQRISLQLLEDVRLGNISKHVCKAVELKVACQR